MDPVMGDPMGTAMGRAIPAAGNPNVAATIPALISIDPHEAALRRWGTALDDACRGANANHNLRKRHCRSQTESKNYCQCDLLHGEFALQGMSIAGIDARFPALVDMNERQPEIVAWHGRFQIYFFVS